MESGVREVPEGSICRRASAQLGPNSSNRPPAPSLKPLRDQVLALPDYRLHAEAWQVGPARLICVAAPCSNVACLMLGVNEVAFSHGFRWVFDRFQVCALVGCPCAKDFPVGSPCGPTKSKHIGPGEPSSNLCPVDRKGALGRPTQSFWRGTACIALDIFSRLTFRRQQSLYLLLCWTKC